MVARPHAHDRLMMVLAALAAAAVLLVPLAVTPDSIDRFRVLKESLARATGILGALGIVIAIVLGGSARFRVMFRQRAVVAVVAAGCTWVLLTTAVSTHRAHSVSSLATFVTSVLMFVTVWYAGPRLSLLVIDVLIPVVVINTGLAALQQYGKWQPFRVDPNDPRHLGTTGLIDNPNVLGSYMALAGLILVVAAVRVRGARGWAYAFGALVATGGVLVSESRAALLAFAAGLVLFAIGGSVKRMAATGIILAALLVFGVALKVPAVMRVVALPRAAQEQGLEVASSGRLAPLLAGLEMVRDRPVTGMGPGAFKYHYMPYKLRAMDDYGPLLRGTWGSMFGEVHNDHVQILAETGIVGYVLFLATIVVLVRMARRAPSDDRGKVAQAIAIPLAGTLLVLCLAQFPLYVAVTRHLLVTFAGLVAGWSGGSE